MRFRGEPRIRRPDDIEDDESDRIVLFPVDRRRNSFHNSMMTTKTTSTGPIAADVFADGEAIIEARLAGRKPDPEIVRRVRERAAKITAEIREKHGVLDIGVTAIREFRDRE
ncbi:MAG TPA: hypothetical protein VGM05_15160 [Planctomycetaceae bacterium]